MGKLSTNQYEKLKKLVLVRDEYKCRVCKFRQNLQVHHVLFRSFGGKDTSENLITLCMDCHTSVHLPNPSTGAKLTIQPPEDSNVIDCNKSMKFIFECGWKPKYVVKNTNKFLQS